MANDQKPTVTQTHFTLAATAVLCFVIHGYRFANDIFSHDALLEIAQNDAAWQIALGRFFQPVLVFLRGNLCSPWLLCLLQAIWLSASVYLLTVILHIHNKFAILAVAGVVVSSEAFIILNASFLIDSDLYAFALFAAIFGVWCLEKKKLRFTVLGIAFMTASLATYQAYISAAFTLLLMLIILRLCDFSSDIWSITKQAIYYAVSLLLTAIIFYTSWQIIRGALGIWAANGYNGMSDLGRFEPGELKESILTAYKNVILYFLEPSVMSNISFREIKLGNIWKYAIVFVNITMAVMVITGIIYICRRQAADNKISKKQRIIRYIFITLLLILYPLACNLACVISKGMEHTLMMFGPTTLYVFAVVISMRVHYNVGSTDSSEASAPIALPVLRKSSVKIVTILLGVIVWVHFIYANQIYLKKSLQEKSAYSLISRIITQIESIPEYDPGITPVAISGYFENSPYLTELRGFEDVKPYSVRKTGLTYIGTDYAMITYYMDININLVRVDGYSAAIQQMPVYPSAGSIAMIDDVLVIKISEQ